MKPPVDLHAAAARLRKNSARRVPPRAGTAAQAPARAIVGSTERRYRRRAQDGHSHTLMARQTAATEGADWLPRPVGYQLSSPDSWASRRRQCTSTSRPRPSASWNGGACLLESASRCRPAGSCAAAMEATSSELPERERAMLRRLDAMTIKLGILVAAGRPETPDQDALTITLADADAARCIADRWRRDAFAFRQPHRRDRVRAPRGPMPQGRQHQAPRPPAASLPRTPTSVSGRSTTSKPPCRTAGSSASSVKGRPASPRGNTRAGRACVARP
jgi:hypothetical protein